MFSLTVDESTRLVLAEPQHAPTVSALIERNQRRLARWQPWAAWPPTVQSSLDYITTGLQNFGKGTEIYTLIEDARDGIVGSCGMRIDPLNLTGDVGYWLDEAAEGRGLVTRSVRALTRAVFADRGLRRVQIRTMVDNRPARAVAERLGFDYEGVLRRSLSFGEHSEDMALYATLEPPA
ncbi:GNAT family N-acetyltransferase [Plantactinospora siamensis]|uniref:GNAT family N-acetyltransferase n=1 Tax=Plantactinospora siamensis TaxID=555372 RepID=A0ABV6NT82_9ACTN